MPVTQTKDDGNLTSCEPFLLGPHITDSSFLEHGEEILTQPPTAAGVTLPSPRGGQRAVRAHGLALPAERPGPPPPGQDRRDRSTQLLRPPRGQRCWARAGRRAQGSPSSPGPS